MYKDTLETLNESIKADTDVKSTWIAFRLMQEESKRIAIEGEVKAFCPDFVFTNFLDIIEKKKEEAEEEALASEEEDDEAGENSAAVRKVKTSSDLR